MVPIEKHLRRSLPFFSFKLSGIKFTVQLFYHKNRFFTQKRLDQQVGLKGLILLSICQFNLGDVGLRFTAVE